MAPPQQNGVQDGVLNDILETLKQVVQNHTQLSAAVDSINGRLNVLSSLDQIRSAPNGVAKPTQDPIVHKEEVPSRESEPGSPTPSQSASSDLHDDEKPPQAPSTPTRKGSVTSRIILTTYPGQAGIDPLQMEWGAKDPIVRGPVVVGRSSNTIRRRNGELSPALSESTAN
jgi:hypothetical protein